MYTMRIADLAEVRQFQNKSFEEGSRNEDSGGAPASKTGPNFYPLRYSRPGWPGTGSTVVDENPGAKPRVLLRSHFGSSPYHLARINA